jgi:hypothetical protein
MGIDNHIIRKNGSKIFLAQEPGRPTRLRSLNKLDFARNGFAGRVQPSVEEAEQNRSSDLPDDGQITCAPFDPFTT